MPYIVDLVKSRYLAESPLHFSVNLDLSLEADLLGLQVQAGPQYWADFRYRTCSLPQRYF
jgi:hypothetical protein